VITSKIADITKSNIGFKRIFFREKTIHIFSIYLYIEII